MRIAVFSYGLPVPSEKRGGIERVAHALSHGLAERGHHVVVFSHDPKPVGAAYEVRPLPWKGFVDTWIGRRMTMGYAGNLLAVLPDYTEFDAVIAHGDSLLLPLKGKPVIRVMHGSALAEALHASSVGRFLLQLGVYAQELLTPMIVRTTVAVSHNTTKSNPLIRHVIPNGVDTKIFKPAASAKTAAPSVSFVGTVQGRKRGAFLLEVFARVIRAAHPDAQLIFVGPQGPTVPGVRYYTGVEDAVLAGLYQQAWVYASPSTYEGFGLPYLEAMACGTAVVATPNPGSREVLADGEYGVLADDAGFGAAVCRLIDDAARRRDLEAAGIRRAQDFSLDSTVVQYEALLLEMCGSRARSIASA